MKILLFTLILFILKNDISTETSLDTEDFENLLLQSDLFVDKSLLINEFLNARRKLTLIVRPSGWGKSVNLDMLRRFLRLEVNQDGNLQQKNQTTNGKLFLGGYVQIGSNQTKHIKRLKIADFWSATQLMGKHPVVLVKMKNTGNSFEEIFDGVRRSIREAFEDHKYLANSSRITIREEFAKLLSDAKLSENELEKSLYFLCWKLNEHFERNVYVLIDDYDAPVIQAYLRFGSKSAELANVVKFLKSLYQSALNSNQYLSKALLCGTLKVSLTNDKDTGLTMLDINTLVDPQFSKCFGLTEPQVQALLNKVPQLNKTIGEMQTWYGGYFDQNENVFYYNCRSVMQCLRHNGTLTHDYAKPTNRSTAMVDKFLTTDNFQLQVQLLLSGEGIKYSNIFHHNTLNWNRIPILEILLLNGYLRRMKIPYQDVETLLVVPNQEMNIFYANKVLEWLTNKLGISVEDFQSLTGTLIAANATEFQATLQKYLDKVSSYLEGLDNQAKLFYDALLISWQAALVQSHVSRVSGKERYNIDLDDEIIMVPKQGLSDTAVAINYKRTDILVSDTLVLACILEIDSAQYPQMLRNMTHVKKFIKIGMVFCEQKVRAKFEVADLNAS